MKERGGLRALKQRHSPLFANTSSLHLPVPRECSIKVDTILLCFRHCDGCQDLQGLIGEERGTFGCVLVGCKTNRSSFYLRGHPQTPVRDALPTKLEVERRRKKGKGKNVDYLPNLQRTHCGIPGVRESSHILLSFLKITQFRQCYTAQGNLLFSGPSNKLVRHVYLHGSAYRDVAEHSESRETH